MQCQTYSLPSHSYRITVLWPVPNYNAGDSLSGWLPERAWVRSQSSGIIFRTYVMYAIEQKHLCACVWTSSRVISWTSGLPWSGREWSHDLLIASPASYLLCHHVKVAWVRRRLQLRFDFNSTAIQPPFDSHSTAVRPHYDHSTLWPACSGSLHCSLNEKSAQREANTARWL